MGDANSAPRQPDFNVIAGEVSKLRNLPAIADGTRVLAEIHNVRAEIHNVRAEIQNVRAEIHNVRAEILTRLSISDHNNAARIQNTYVVSPTFDLTPLLNSSTGGAILGFPTMSAEIKEMPEPQLDNILRELGVPLAASRTGKERQLRVQIGFIEDQESA